MAGLTGRLEIEDRLALLVLDPGQPGPISTTWWWTRNDRTAETAYLLVSATTPVMTREILDLVLVLLVVASATTCIAAHYRNRQRLFWISKPLTLGFVLLLASQPSLSTSSIYQGLLVTGLVFSLAGDVFLMLPSDRFVAGLASFFVGHVFYVAAFAADAGPASAFVREPLLLLAMLAASAGLYAYLWSGLGDMKLPVAVYGVGIAAMAWQATARWNETEQFGALLACSGALLFVVSDSVLAVNRFRRSFGAAQAVVLGTYFSAQCLIALSIGSGDSIVDWAMR